MVSSYHWINICAIYYKKIGFNINLTGKHEKKGVNFNLYGKKGS